MNIQDIIEAAITRQEKANDHLHQAYSMNTTLGYLYQIREEVALMEAVCEAATLAVTPNTGAVAVRVYPHAIDAVAALVAYRKERGL